jgi:non-ribosomal peptide synthetase component F
MSGSATSMHSQPGLVSRADPDLFRRFGFGAKSAVPFPTVHHAFIHHATRSPEEIALLDLRGGQRRKVTYGELLRQAQCIATLLNQNEVKPESRVLLLVKRSPEMVAGILGILMAGAQYVPMDGCVVPDETLQHAVGQCNITVALCLREFESRLRDIHLVSSVLVLEDILSCDRYINAELSPNETICEGDGDSGCYVIYTSGACPTLDNSTSSNSCLAGSGTTGEPKGVDVTHRNVTNILCQSPGNLGMAPGRKVGQVLSISFDMGESRSPQGSYLVSVLTRCRRLGDPRQHGQRGNIGSTWLGLGGDIERGAVEFLRIINAVSQSTSSRLTS